MFKGILRRVFDLGGLFALGLAAGCGTSHEAEDVAAPPRPIQVTAAPVQLRQVERTIATVGTLFGFEQFTITPKVEGRVQVIHHDVGDRVAPGAVLLELDDTDYRLAVEEAQQALQQDLAKLGVDQIPSDDFDVESVPSVERARLLLENAQQQYERQRKLASAQAASAEVFERAATDLKVAQATWQQAQLEVRSTLASVRYKHTLLQQAQQRLAECQVRAPDYDPGPSYGDEVRYVVSQRLVAVGEMVRAFPSTAVFELVLDDVLKFRTRVPERYIAGVHSGLQVRITVDAWPGKQFPGEVARVNPTVDPRSRTFEIEVRVPNSQHLLKQGGFAKAEVITEPSAQALTVPVESLVTFAGVTKMFLVRNQQADEVVVELGTRGTGWVEAIGDFEPGDLVVTSGQSALADGTPIFVRQPEARTAARLRR